MPKYRLKSEEELVWNAVRRAATARIRLKHAAMMEHELNDVLPQLQVEFQNMVQAGNLPELDEAHLKEWVKDAVDSMHRPRIGS